MGREGGLKLLSNDRKCGACMFVCKLADFTTGTQFLLLLSYFLFACITVALVSSFMLYV
jgi:hypothetical protein